MNDDSLKKIFTHVRVRYGLTFRQADVASLAVAGFKNKAIAVVLRIGEQTVNQQLDRVYLKAKVSGRAALAARVIEDVMEGLEAVSVDNVREFSEHRTFRGTDASSGHSPLVRAS